MASHIARRKFLATLVGGAAAACPLAARAQQPTLPIVGFLGASSFETSVGRSLLWFQKGLGETGYVEDRNVRIEYRWADDEYERLPSLAMELVHRRVAVLVAGGSPVALPAKAATSETPVVFMTGLVRSKLA
jgi:putative tryptophan/tyrosine transport system substrate-binding protein